MTRYLFSEAIVEVLWSSASSALSGAMTHRPTVYPFETSLVTSMILPVYRDLTGVILDFVACQ